MDEQFELHKINFVWDRRKLKINLAKHGISFEQAAEAFFDPFIKIVDVRRLVGKNLPTLLVFLSLTKLSQSLRRITMRLLR